MNILPISELNKALNTDSGKVVSEAEELYHGQLEAAVSDIAENCKEKPIILLSGPSGSAKLPRRSGLSHCFGETVSELMLFLWTIIFAFERTQRG